VLVDELLHRHEAAANPDHEYPVDDLSRYDLGAEEILAGVNPVDWDLHLMVLNELLKHLVHYIVVDALVFDVLREWVSGGGGLWLLSQPVNDVSHGPLQGLGLLERSGLGHRLLL
jgi:hypothetical protein